MKLGLLFIGILNLLVTDATEPLASVELNNTYDSIIVAKITDITGDQYDAIESAVTNIDQLNIEYCCMWSGIMILKLNSSPLSESGDIHLFIRSTLTQATPLKKLEILHVYTGISGLAKC